MASGYHQQELAPGGCSHAVFLNLHYHSPAPSKIQQSYLHRGRLHTQLVTARDDMLVIYDVYERVSFSTAASNTTNSSGQASTSLLTPEQTQARHKLVVARRQHLFGTVTGLQRVQTLATDKDGRDRLLVSFNDAKLALLEWNDAIDDLETVSIHTYERAPQLLNGTPHLFRPSLNVDPLSRCAALLLPHDALAILPFYRDEADFDFDDDVGLDLAKDDAVAMAAAAKMESLPYSPSFVLTMREVDPKIRNLKDFCFLPGFQKPTVAVLFAHSPTWTGLLSERKDTFAVYLFTLDLSASLDGAALGSTADAFDDGAGRSAHPVVTTSSQLPFDCLYMLPCPQTLGGVLVVCMSSILHVDQSGRVVITALNPWFKTLSAIEPESVLELPGVADLQSSQLVFTSETEGVLSLVNGDLYRFRCQMDGRSVEGIRLERMEQSLSGSEVLVPATGPPTSCLAIAPHATDPAQTSGASAGFGYLFGASMAGDSALYALERAKITVKDEEGADDIYTKAQTAASRANDMELDLDDELYGTSGAADYGTANSKAGSKENTVPIVRKVDVVRSHGGLHGIARRKVSADEPGSSKRYSLVGACGSGNQAGLVYLDPRFVPQRRTKIVAGAASEASQASTASFSKVFVVGQAASKGIRMIASRSQDNSSIAFTALTRLHSSSLAAEQASWSDVTELSGATICAGALLDRSAVARITAHSVQVLASDSLEIIHETTLTKPDEGGSIHHACLDADQYAVIHTTDGDTLVYRYDQAQQQFEPIDVSAAIGGASPVVSANVFSDTFGHIERSLRTSTETRDDGAATVTSGAQSSATAAVPAARLLSSLPNDEEEVDYGEDDEDHILTTKTENSSNDNQVNGAKPVPVESAPAYLFALDADGMSRIWTLPDLQLVWKNASLAAQPQRLRYENRGHGELAPEQVAVMSTAVACHIGDTLSIVSLTSDNFLAVYRSNTWASTEEVEKARTQLQPSNEKEVDEGRTALGLTFNKVLVQLLSAPAGGARSFDPNGNSPSGYQSGAVQLQAFSVPSREEQPGAERHPNALVVLGGGRESQASVLCWTEEGSYRLLDWPEGDLSSLAAIPPPTSPAEGSPEAQYAYCDREGQIWLGLYPEGLHSSTTWTSSVVRTGREYTKVVSHDPTHTVIAASVQPCRFVLFDEDGEPIRTGNEAEENLEEALPSLSHRGALELFINEDRTTAADGYEFEANETVTALEIVTLDAPSTASGRKQFIAAGTTTFHGEDRTAKGSVYLFEVIEVVASKYQVGRDLRLKLVCRDDSRAPVTAIAELDGFLVSTCGQKLYVRALEKEEWLISVAFLDCPFYVTSIRVVKNFILLSDAKKSLWFLAFQEEPYRFVDLGRDINDHHATLGQYLVYNERLSLVSTSGDALGGISGFGVNAGVIRLYEYAPHVATSLGGHRLLLRTEFQTPSEAVGSTMCRGKWLSDSELRGREEGRNRLLLAKANGALDSLAAVDEKVAKRLHLLQGQLVRSIMHTAALNPRAFRAVRNDFVSRALNKGILDARLLDCFLYLSRPKMLEAVRTLAGLFDGLDQIKPDKVKRKRTDSDPVREKAIKVEIEDAENTKVKPNPDEAQERDPAVHSTHEAEEKEEQEAEEDDDEDFTKQEQLRLQTEHKRVQLILKDLLRLRLGFEQV